MKHALIFVLLMLTGICTASAESTRFGDYEVHEIIFTTDFLQPDVAAAYKVTRAGDRALLNISVRQHLPEGGDQAVRASVSGTRSDLIHKTPLEFQEIVEQGAVYYIAEFGFIDEEVLYFDIKVRPEGQSSTFDLSFQKKLYDGGEQ